MRDGFLRAMTAAIAVIAVICATGLVSAQIISPVQPDQTLVVAPPEPPTPTPTPTPVRPPVVGPLEPVIQPPIAPTATTVQPPTPTPTAPTATPTGTVTVLPTTPTATMPAPVQTVTSAPGVTPLQPPGVQPTPAPQDAVGGAVETQISSGPGDSLFPAISGGYVVWYDNASASIQLYEIASGNLSTISTAASVPLPLPHELAIGGMNVVWTGRSPWAEGDIVFLYDIASGRLQQVTNGSGVPGYPGVSQDFVVWIDGDELGDLYLYEIASGSTIQVTDDPYEQLLADAGGDRFAWADNETEGGDLDIAVASRNDSRVRLLGDAGDDSHPDLSGDGNRLAWINANENRTAVYLYDASTGNITQVTGESARPDTVAVDGDHLVYSDGRNGNPDIFLYNISTGVETPVTNDPYARFFPDISDGVAVWMGNNTGQWEIYMWEVPGGR